MKTYVFAEPHHTGGDSVVTITEDKILKYMQTRREHEKRLQGVSDEDLVDYFIVNHWCTELK